jgi:type 1 glutamine amidotransferase
MSEKRKALVVWGGWDGHEPKLVADRVEKVLTGEGFDVVVKDTLDAFLDVEYLKTLDLIYPVWTMGNITGEQCGPVLKAVASGVGLAGNHGGICDAFRNNTEWQFMTGGQWVAHPGNDGTPYKVNIKNNSSCITFGLKDFDVASEQYYLHVDPVVEVLATTRFPVANGPHITNKAVDMPVVWTKMWGYGRVFYTSLGHHDDVFNIPEAGEILRRGMLWAADGKKIAVENGTTDPSEFFTHKFV